MTLLHNFVHGTDGSNLFTHATRTSDLAAGWHIYTLDWRPGLMTFYLDGIEVSRFVSSSVPSVRMVVVLDLAVGWCGPADAITASQVTMQVDWVRATR